MFSDRLRALLRACLAVGVLLIGAIAGSSEGTERKPEPLERPGLHNLFEVDERLYSGGSAEDESGFQSLASMGVKVLISVDGAKPNVELARKHGMRYVHLPIGYDRLPATRIAELVKAASNADGGIYVHCHHGKHRGPAAVAAIARSLKHWDADRALAWLHQAGTSHDYAGLYRDIEAMKLPDAATLAAIPDNLPEIAQTTSEVDAMVSIDESFDQLKAAKSAQWRQVPGHPDARPREAAAILWENLRELGRTGDHAKRAEGYRKSLGEAEAAALALKENLSSPTATQAARDSSFAKVSRSCTECHRKHRN